MLVISLIFYAYDKIAMQTMFCYSLQIVGSDCI